jgi:hypothetical protein
VCGNTVESPRPTERRDRMGTKKPAEAGPATPVASAADSKARKPWKKKTPVEIVVEQIDKLRDEVTKDEEALKAKRRQLQKMEEARKLFDAL